MTDQEALDLVTAVLTGTTDPRTVTNVRPALQRLAAVVAAAGRDVSDAEIAALRAVLDEEMDSAAYMARSRDYDNAEALRTADAEAERKNCDLYRRALAAAWNVRAVRP